MKKILYIITGLILLSFYACQKYDNPTITNTSTYPLSGEWWVKLEQNTGNNVWVDAGGGYFPLLTYNTSSNVNDSIWIDDQTIAIAKFKIPCNVVGKTYDTIHWAMSQPVTESILDPTDTVGGAYSSDSANFVGTYFLGLHITVVDKVLPVDSMLYSGHIGLSVSHNSVFVAKGATTPGGNISDSIAIGVKFSFDPGVYRYVGYRRTGFGVDDH